MKQLYLLVAFGLFLSTLAYGQVPRKIMLEEFTNASCGPCAAQNPAFNALIDANYDDVVALKYQWYFPGFDPMNQQNPDEPDARIRYYNESGVPVTAINGLVPSGTYGGGNWSGYDGGPYGYRQAVIDFEKAKTSPISMELSHELTEALDSVAITLKVTNVTDDDLNLSDGRLHVALYEKEIVFPVAPGSNGEREFYDVMRKMVPDQNGTTFMGLAAKSSIDITMKVPMPSYYYNLGEAGVIAFIQDNATREVWQSARSTPKALVGYGDAELQTVSDALPSVCARSIEPFAEVRNAGNTQITDLVIEYTLDSEDPVVENWTGTLEPGDKIRFTFDEVMLGDDPRSLNFEITSVNGKADYNPSNISQFSASIASIPEAANPGPAELGVEDKSVGEYPSGVAAVPPVPAGVDGFGTFTVVGPSWTFAGGDKMGAYGDSDNSIWINFFDWNPADANAKDEATLTFHKVDMTDLTDSYFRFDRAGARLTGLSRDEIIIEASTDCGATWQEIEKLRGRDLATVSNTNNRFVPSDRDWVTDEFSLEDYDGVSELIIQIRAISDWGNNNFLDNIVIGGKLPTGTKEINLLDGKVEIFPNPTNNVANIQFELEAATDVDIDIYDVTGKLIETLASKRAFPAGTHTMIWDGAENSGLYTVKIRTEIGEITKKVTVF